MKIHPRCQSFIRFDKVRTVRSPMSMGSSLGSGGNLGTDTRAWGTSCELGEQIGNLVREEEGRRKKGR